MGTTGTIAGAAETPRCYLLETENGTVRRNRSHVNPIPNPMYFVATTMNLTKTLSQEPIKWSLHLPYKPLESTLSRVDLLLERFPRETSRADGGKSQSQRLNDTAIVLHETAGNPVLTGQTKS